MDSRSTSAATPIPESVANALMSIHPRYNSFHQHNAMPNTPLGMGARYEQTADSPGMTAHQNHSDVGPAGSGSAAVQGAIQPAPTSIVNLTNSSDVVIGPMTQYQGAVTIYQYMDATVEATRIATGRNNQNRGLPSSESSSSTLRQERYFIYGALIFFAIVGFSTAIYFIVHQAQGADGMRQPRDILFGDNYNPRTIPTLGNNHMIIDRNNWGTQDGVQASVRLERPVPYVVVTHIGVRTKNCTDVYQCSNKMRILQDAAIGERYLPDIPSNFYIGGDANVYVGRGWNIANAYHNRTLSVCFMGDYNVNAPTEAQLSALHHLLTYGVVKDVLSRDFRLVARRQTKASTTSPGDKLYARVVQLSRWNPCGTASYAHCGAELGFPVRWDDEMLYNERNGLVNPLLTHRKAVEEE